MLFKVSVFSNEGFALVCVSRLIYMNGVPSHSGGIQSECNMNLHRCSRNRPNSSISYYNNCCVLVVCPILAEQQVVAAKSKTVLVKNLNGFFILMSKSLFADS